MKLISTDHSLAQYSSWLVGGKAQFFCLPKSIDELVECVRWAQGEKHEITVLGGGSNVLISDAGVPGLTICLKNFSGIIEKGVGQFEVLSGTNKSELLKLFLKQKLPPALFLAGIPGEVGGGVVMNAGVAENFCPREFGEIVSWIEVLKPDLSLQKYLHSQIQWSYRHSMGWQPGIITRVGIEWRSSTEPSVLVESEPSVLVESEPSVLEKVKAANHQRLSKQPLDMPSCGSVFMNPPGMKAAQLIDSCNLKGFTLGGAQVSRKHANFIVNTGGATAAELWAVIQHVQKTVRLMRSVDLCTEVVRLGNWTEDWT